LNKNFILRFTKLNINGYPVKEDIKHQKKEQMTAENGNVDERQHNSWCIFNIR
jgi:hypothetical protein